MLATLHGATHGLTRAETVARLESYGSNVLLTRPPLPLLAVQLLWLNLVSNGIQDVALTVPVVMEIQKRARQLFGRTSDDAVKGQG